MKEQIIEIAKEVFANRGVPEDKFRIDPEWGGRKLCAFYINHLTYGGKDYFTTFLYDDFILESKEDKVDFVNRMANIYYQIPNKNWKVIDVNNEHDRFSRALENIGYITRVPNTIAEYFDGKEYESAFLHTSSKGCNISYSRITFPTETTGLTMHTFGSIKQIQCRADALLPVIQPGIKSLIQPPKHEYYEGKLLWVYPTEQLVFVFLQVGGWISMHISQFVKSLGFWPQEIQEEFTMWEGIN